MPFLNASSSLSSYNGVRYTSLYKMVFVANMFQQSEGDEARTGSKVSLPFCYLLWLTSGVTIPSDVTGAALWNLATLAWIKWIYKLQSIIQRKVIRTQIICFTGYMPKQNSNKRFTSKLHEHPATAGDCKPDYTRSECMSNLNEETIYSKRTNMRQFETWYLSSVLKTKSNLGPPIFAVYMLYALLVTILHWVGIQATLQS